MTIRRLHFEGSIPQQQTREFRKGRASQAVGIVVVLAAMAWSFSGFTVTPSQLDYGNKAVGTASLEMPVELTNRSSSDVHPLVRVEGESASDFDSSSSACATIRSGDSCTLPVRFVPHAPGEKHANLVIRMGAEETTSVALTGKALSPDVTVSPLELKFPGVTVGSSAEEEINLASNGWFHVRSVTLEGAGESQFNTEISACNPESAGSGHCSIKVTFAPQSPGPFLSTLVIDDDGAQSPHKVSLFGDGVNPMPTPTPPVTSSIPAPPSAPQNNPPRQLRSVQIEPSQLDFSQSRKQQVNIRNTGNTALRLTGIEIRGDDAEHFKADNRACSDLEPQTSCQVTVQYLPKVKHAKKKDSYSAVLALTHNAQEPIPFNVTLNWEHKKNSHPILGGLGKVVIPTAIIAGSLATQKSSGKNSSPTAKPPAITQQPSVTGSPALVQKQPSTPSTLQSPGLASGSNLNSKKQPTPTPTPVIR
jgi:hypothetical protein